MTRLITPQTAGALDLWVVRASRSACFIHEFLERRIVSIGLSELIGEEALLLAREELIERAVALHAGRSRQHVVRQACQLARFLKDVAIGDRVAAYDAEHRLYVLGRVTSEPRFDASAAAGQPFVRSVEWTDRVFRDRLSISTRYSLGTTRALFRLHGEGVEELIELAVPIEAAAAVVTPARAPRPSAEETSLADLGEEIRQKAAAFIEDRIAKLDEQELQILVAGTLRAMGFKTRVCSFGLDRSFDVFASPDGLGLEEPRIFVKVKHRTTSAMGDLELRTFLGGRDRGARWVYVNTGGFTRDAYHEADRSGSSLTLLGLRKLQELLIEHYAAMDLEVQQLVPLTKIYWPVADE